MKSRYTFGWCRWYGQFLTIALKPTRGGTTSQARPGADSGIAMHTLHSWPNDLQVRGAGGCRERCCGRRDSRSHVMTLSSFQQDSGTIDVNFQVGTRFMRVLSWCSPCWSQARVLLFPFYRNAMQALDTFYAKRVCALTDTAIRCQR